MGIDDTHIKLRGAPVLDEAALDAHQKMIADKLSVAELMTEGVTALPPLLPVAHLIDVLRSCNHQVRRVEESTDKPCVDVDLTDATSCWVGQLMTEGRDGSVALQAFPVTAEVDLAAEAGGPWPLHGVILRSTLLRMLAHQLGLTPGDGSADGSAGGLQHAAAYTEVRGVFLPSPG